MQPGLPGVHTGHVEGEDRETRGNKKKEKTEIWGNNQIIKHNESCILASIGWYKNLNNNVCIYILFKNKFSL